MPVLLDTGNVAVGPRLTDLLYVLFPSRYPPARRLLVVLATYIDESLQDQPGVFAMAGYVFTAGNCARFEEQWEKALASERPMPLQRFHMVEFENRRGPFADWKSDRYRHQFLGRLIDIIRNNNQCLVAVAIDLRAFDALTPEEKRLLQKPGLRTLTTAYTLCFEIFLAEVVKWLRSQGYTERVAYVLDVVGRDKGKGALYDQFCSLQNDPIGWKRYQMASLTWKDSKDTVELQAADILVYEFAKDVARFWNRTNRDLRITSWLDVVRMGMGKRTR